MRKTVYFGDSITAQFKQLSTIPHVINMGVGGDKTIELVGRLNAVTLEQPDKLFVLVGINDFLVNKGKFGNHLVIPIEDVYRVLLQTLKISIKQCEFNILAIFPVNSGSVIREEEVEIFNYEIDELNQRIRRLAESFEMNFIDITTHFKDESNALKREFTPDGIHLTTEAYDLYFNLMKDRL